MRPKTTLALGIGLAWALVTPLAQAFTYTEGDLLLAFRKTGYNDVLFNLGNVSRLTGLADGVTVPLDGWDITQATETYGSDLTDGVSVAVIAATGSSVADPVVYLSEADGGAQSLERSPLAWRSLWSKAASVGLKAQEYTAASSPAYFVANPSLYASYTFIGSNSGQQPALISSLGGTSSFKIESSFPGKALLVAVRPSTLNPKPASQVLGTLTVGVDGSVSFLRGVAAVKATHITGARSVGERFSVTFDTVSGVHYRLRSSADAGAKLTAWTSLPDVIVGTGAPATLEDRLVAGPQFYVVEAF